ncbi:FG-GAP-like repeat-containing protein [Streptomyces sp. NPDC059382]|uniref:FG-GAP-like repeat-containing protein n=1 Tax=Streptomyces sp. NPDC059382 TaxID=3346816 RepID=UPI0036995E18
MSCRSRGAAALRMAAAAGALSMVAAGLTLAAAGAAQADPGPLRAAFNHTSISADNAPAGADFDGTGASLSASDLDNAGWTRGARITVNGTPYRRPDVAPGEPDNVLADGQTIALAGSGNALGFLASAAHGRASGTGTVTYSDGSVSAYSLTVDDWKTGSATTAAVTLPHTNTPGGLQDTPARLYAVTVPLVAGKSVTSVTLPKAPAADGVATPALHVYSLAVRSTPTAPAGKSWTGSWAASFGSAPPVHQSADWRDQTLRMVVNPHTSGTTARIRFANTFSTAPVRLGHVTIASQQSGARATQTPLDLTFEGSRHTVLPAGGEVFSDPVTFPVTAGQNLLVSIHLPGPVSAAPVHEYALTTSYTTARLGGDHTADPGASSFPGAFSFWTYLSGIDVATGTDVGTLVALGDSQTDGAHSTNDTNRRWPDLYAAIQKAKPDTAGVLNAGISANQLLRDRTHAPGSAGGLARLDRDVFAQSNVRTIVLYEGVNDILQDADAASLKDGIRKVAEQSRARGLRTIVATIPAFGGSPDYTESREDTRQAVNAYIRTTTDIDEYVDFDLATRDPDMPYRLRDGIYNPTDHLHFNDAGTKVLAQTLASGTHTGPPAMSQTVSADFTGDGKPDLIARDDSTGTLKLWRGEGNKTFTQPTVLTAGWRIYSQTTAADITGDRKADLIARDPAGDLKLWAGRGDGTFQSPSVLTDGWNFTQTTAADFTGDGKADLIASDPTGTLKIWTGNGNGTFSRPTPLTEGWSFTQTTAADFTGDGKADLVASDPAGTLKIWTGNGNGTFSRPTPLTGGWNFTQTTAADFTSDGKADLIARDDTTATLLMWTGLGNGTFSTRSVLATGW